jgi:multiple PDZ domain protein
MDMMPLETPLPEMEKFTVELKKDYHGLGITIAGYVCEKGESALSKSTYE